MDPHRRSSISAENNGMQPATKVVGFRVEGAAQSPSPGPSLLNETASSRAGTGSPNPVFIPPAFQTGPQSLSRRSADPIVMASSNQLAAMPLQRTTTTPAVLAQHAAQISSPSRRSVSSPDETMQGQQLSPRGRVATAQSLPPVPGSQAQELRQSIAAGVGRGPSEGQEAKPRPSRGPSDVTGSARPDPAVASSAGHTHPQPDEAQAHAAPSQPSAFAAPAAQAPPGASAAGEQGTQGGKTRHSGEDSRGHSGRSSGERDHERGRADSRSGAESGGERRGAVAGSVSRSAAGKEAASHQPLQSQPQQQLKAQQQSRPGKDARGGAGSSSVPPAGSKEQGEKKAMTRAERRAQQEAQRAAKAADKAARDRASQGEAEAPRHQPVSKQNSSAGLQSSHPPSRAASFRAPAPDDAKRRGSVVPKREPAPPDPISHTTEMFAHLPPFKALSIEGVLRDNEIVGRVHPCILRLGFKNADGSLKGGNQRAIALIAALRQLIQDYTTPEGKVMSRDLTQQLNAAIAFLVECRPISVSMGNTIKFLKLQVGKLHPSKPEEEAKQDLIKQLDDYLEEKIRFAEHMLVTNAVAKISNDEVLLTYGQSSTIHAILLCAHKLGRRIRVIIVDSRPQNEGRLLLQKLLRHGIPCTYTHLNALSYVMEEASKVFLGASAVHTNGTVLGRAGTAAVAMMAATYGKPVLICCETYKFHERVQLDSFTYNELGDPNALVHVPVRPAISALSSWQQQPCLGLLNLEYDVMPADYITLIITEFGAIPSTSVPVILREYRQQPTLNGQASS